MGRSSIRVVIEGRLSSSLSDKVSEQAIWVFFSFYWIWKLGFGFWDCMSIVFWVQVDW